MISLITGASSGIGKDMAFEFAGRGYDLILVARSLDRLKEVKNEIIKKYGKCNVEIMKWMLVILNLSRNFMMM